MPRMIIYAAVAALAPLTLCAGASPGAAEPVYPWCAHYGGVDVGGAINCGFNTREQCLAAISGVGGHCEMNVNWPPPSSAPRLPRPRTASPQ